MRKNEKDLRVLELFRISLLRISDFIFALSRNRERLFNLRRATVLTRHLDGLQHRCGEMTESQFQGQVDDALLQFGGKLGRLTKSLQTALQHVPHTTANIATGLSLTAQRSGPSRQQAPDAWLPLPRDALGQACHLLHIPPGRPQTVP
jgi:hypothetical protein